MRSLTLQTGDTIVTSGEELGKLSFAASSESDGGSAISVGARVIAQAEGSFQSSSNPTSLVFATASASAAASGKIKISDNGHILPMINNTYDVGDQNLRFRNTFAASGYFSDRVATSGSVFFASGNTFPVGAMQWDDGEGTVSLGLKGGNVTASLAQDSVALCYNGTASSLTKGQVVYVSGAQGQRPSVNLAIATSDLTSARTFGLSDETITAGAEGFVATFGVVTNLNTASFVAGSALWLSADTPGALTMTRPVAPNHGVFVGWCLNAHASAGRIFVNVQNGYELDELHDVLITSPASGDIIRYDSSAGIWRNTANTSGGGAGVTVLNSGDNRVLTSTGSTSGINAESNLTFDGTKLNVVGDITVDNLTLDSNTIVSSSGNLVVAPAASGALVASTTGNARGIFAVDLQTSRTANTQVAGGSHSVIGGGQNNTSSESGSTVGGGVNNTSSNTYSTVGGGQNNLSRSARSTIAGGTNNVAAQKVHRANDITASTNTITVLNATAADFDDTTANAVEIRYFYNNVWTRITRTASTATQSGNNVTLVLTSNVGAASQAWTQVTVVNTAETDTGIGSTIGGGVSNISSGTGSTVGGGRVNTSSGDYYSTVGGGQGNTSSGTGSTVGGGQGNTSSGSYSTVGGGDGNTSSSYAGTVGGGRANASSDDYSTVGGGYKNISSGGGSTVGGGRYNTSSGSYSTIGGGQANTASGYASTVGGGANNTSSGSYSTVGGGLGAKATRHGETSHASGPFAADGDAQHTVLIARRATTDATANVVLTLNGETPGSTNRLTLPAETTWSFGIKLAAYNDTDNTGAWWTIRGGVRRNAANGTSLIGSLIVERDSEGVMSGTSASIVADDTNEALEIRVTGLASKNIRWIAVVDISQVSYGTP